MVMKIEHDYSRFKQIVRGKIRAEPAEVRDPRRNDRPQGTRSGQHSAPALDVPHFRYGKNGGGGVGQGEGEEGSPVAPGDGEPGGGRARPAASRAAMCSKSKSRSKSWPRSWPTNCSCRASSPRARRTSAGKSPLHEHSPLGSRVAAALQAHLHGSSAAADLFQDLQRR